MQKRELVYGKRRNLISEVIASLGKGIKGQIKSSSPQFSIVESIGMLGFCSIVFSLMNMVFLANLSSNNIINNIYSLTENFDLSKGVSVFNLSNWTNVFVIGSKAIFIESLMIISFIALINLLSNKKVDFKNLIVSINISYIVPIAYISLGIVASAVSVQISMILFIIAKITQYKLLYNYIKSLTGLSVLKTTCVYPMIIVASELITVAYFKESIFALVSSIL
ncbi:hypothetical protein [Tepidibacter aestuarii]|uniref:hypothetical protein n=1 Tax=Tepidibacter aestuarii TaxID=2925782 RepID=UPI0020BECB8D|nr:hypothetical protein [Tepidibacter aestuarii]CAH2212990.1 membrane protein of unknown function [Tepidibacter aestuarii]